jgi:ATP-dependent Lon protease
MDEVLLHALVRQPVPIVWKEDLSVSKTAVSPDDDMAGIVAH